jgi:hypothetical protein
MFSKTKRIVGKFPYFANIAPEPISQAVNVKRQSIYFTSLFVQRLTEKEKKLYKRRI